MKINKLLIVCLAVAMSVPGFAQENAGTAADISEDTAGTAESHSLRPIRAFRFIAKQQMVFSFFETFRADVSSYYCTK